MAVGTLAGGQVGVGVTELVGVAVATVEVATVVGAEVGDAGLATPPPGVGVEVIVGVPVALAATVPELAVAVGVEDAVGLAEPTLACGELGACPLLGVGVGAAAIALVGGTRASWANRPKTSSRLRLGRMASRPRVFPNSLRSWRTAV